MKKFIRFALFGANLITLFAAAGVAACSTSLGASSEVVALRDSGPDYADFVTKTKQALLLRHEYGHINEDLAGVNGNDNSNHSGWHSEGGFWEGTWEPPAQYDHKPVVAVSVVIAPTYWAVNALCGGHTFEPPKAPALNVPVGATVMPTAGFAPRAQACAISEGYGAYKVILPPVRP